MNQPPSPVDRLDGLDHFREALGYALVGHARSLLASPAPVPRSRRRPRVLLAVATVAGVLAAALIVGLGTPPSSGPQAATAAAMLRSAAASVLAHPIPALGPHEYFFVDLEYTARGVNLGYPTHALVTQRGEQWVARDGAGLAVGAARPGAPPRVTPLERSRTPFPFGLIALSYRALMSLPTNPDRLSRALATVAARQQRERPVGEQLLAGRSGQTYILFATIRDAFEAPSPPALRAALYELLARTPGLHPDGAMRDHLGRRGLAVSIVLGAVRFRMIVDRSTGELLESQRILIRRSDQLGPGNPLGLFSRGTILSEGVVSRIGQRPHP